MNGTNRSTVIVNLTDVQGKTITDQVEITFFNQRASSLNQKFKVNLRGAAPTLENIPAFPFGLAEVFIKPSKYRHKSIFLDVPAGEAGRITERLMVDPDRVTPVFPTFTDISTQPRWANFRRVLDASKIGADSWSRLEDQKKAGLLNIFAKMQDEVVDGAQTGFTFLNSIEKILPARLFAQVNRDLLKFLVNNPERFRGVPGELHDFEGDWKRIDAPNSFKSNKGRAGTLQMTFAGNSAGLLLADIDIDDHAGIKHAADVLKHHLTQKDTHPYDIREILVLFHGIDPGYHFA